VRGAKGLAATAAVRLFAVVGLLLGPELALNSSLRHKTCHVSQWIAPLFPASSVGRGNMVR
jgi:hypothetical protein